MFLKVEFYVFTLLALCKKTGNKNIWFRVAFRNFFATILRVFLEAEARALTPLTYLCSTQITQSRFSSLLFYSRNAK